MRLCASAHVKGSECVRLLASVCVCSRLLASVSRLCASVCVCVRLLASVCVGRLVSRASASVCVCSRLCASVVLSRVRLRLLVGTGSFYASVVIQRVQRWGELAQVFAICLASYYPLAVHIDYVDYMNKPLIF